jgi:hypothetical protein
MLWPVWVRAAPFPESCRVPNFIKIQPSHDPGNDCFSDAQISCPLMCLMDTELVLVEDVRQTLEAWSDSELRRQDTDFRPSWYRV